MSNSKLIGTSVQRTDVLDKALGRTQYGQDYWLPGTLYGGVLRSRYPAARIVSIDTSAAERLSGVHAVMTAKDVPGRKTYGGPLKLDHPALADEKVLYHGQAIALVAAESRELTGEAIRLIAVEYEEIPSVFDPLEAMRPDAPKIGEDGNVAAHLWLNRGDIQQGFSEADIVIEDTYRTKWIDHAALEVECGMAWVDESGVVTVRVPTQSIEYYQQIAAVLALPPEQVRVISPMVGGGFGRKLDITVEVYLALLAWRTRRPVYLESTREESIIAYSKRHPLTMHYKTGASRDGRLVAMQVDLVADAGPFVYRSALLCLHSIMTASGPYYIPNVKLDAKAIFTNNTFTSAMRAVGASQTNFAYESQMDRVARELGMDPLEFRRINYLTPGQDLPNRQVIHDAIMLPESAEGALKALGEPRRGSGSKKVGRGISSNLIGWGFPDNPASCKIEVQSSGNAVVSIGVPDIGGGQSSAVAQIVADILGLPLDNISLHISDTAATPLVGPTAGSKTLYYTGNATYLAAIAIRKRLLEVASDLIEANPEDLELGDGKVFVKGHSERGIAITQVIAESSRRGIQLQELSAFKTPTEKKYDSETSTGIDWLGFTFGTHAAEVEVDEDTGEVTVLKYALCHDVGRAIHPASVEGQMEGGVAQGLGFTLTEEVVIRDGITLTPSLQEYLIPTSLDVPEITPIILESGEGLGSFSNRGIGEPPACATAGAIANAIYDAVGVRITELPITSERVFNALQQKRFQSK